LLAVVCGCALDGGMTVAPGAAATGSASGETNPFAPPPPPQGFDAQRAKARLSEIPGDPPAPANAPATTPELPQQALRRVAEARRLFAQQRYAETLDEVEGALRYNANNVEATRLGALAALMSGKTAQARTYAEAAVTLWPGDHACHYVLAKLAEKADDAEAALLEYRKALKCPLGHGDDSYRPLTQYQLGLLLVEMSYYNAAIEQLEAFEKFAAALGARVPENPELATILRVKRSVPLLALADAYEAMGQYGHAADVLARAAKLAEDDANLRVRLIKDLVRAKRFDAASDEALRYATAGKADRKAIELLLAVYRASGKPRRAVDALQQLMAANPDDMAITLLYVDALVDARQFARAVNVLNDLIARHPDAADARWKLIAIHRFQGNRREWLWVVAAQLAQEPADDMRARSELAQLPGDDATRLVNEELTHKPTAAQSAPAGSQDPKVASARCCCLGWLAERLDRLDEARTLFTRAMELKGDFVPAAASLACWYMNRCQWEKAVSLLDTTPTDDRALQALLARLLGQCYDGLDRFDEAAKAYRDAIEKNAADTGSMVSLARLLERAGEPKESARVYEQVIKLAPDLVEAREQLIVNLLNRWSEGDNLKQVLAQLKELQSKASDHPATARATALVRLLMRTPPDLVTYARVLTSLIEARPSDLASRRSLCIALLRMGDYDAALREVKALLSRSPYEAEGNELLAMTLMRQLQIEEAAEQLTRCLTWYPKREAFLRNLAEVRLVQQDYPRAAELWQTLLDRKLPAARRALYRRRLIITYLQAESYDKARQSADQWLEGAEEDELPTIRSYLLAADAAEEAYDRYIDRCRKWLEADRDDVQIREWLLGVGELPGGAEGGLIGAGRHDEAVAMATAWVAQDPDEPVVRRLLVQTLRAVRRPTEIIEIARADLSLADKPQAEFPPLQTLVDAYTLAKRYDDAIATAKQLGAQAAQIAGTDLSFEIDQLMVSLLAQAKRYDDAIAQSNKMISDLDEMDGRLEQLLSDEKDAARRLVITKEQEKVRQRRADALRSVSFVYTKDSRRDLAIDCLRQALKLVPGDAGINNDLGYTLADAGMDLNEAERMLRRAVSEVLWNGVGEDEQQAAFTDSLGWLCYKRGRFPQARRWLALAARMESGQDAVIYDHLGDAEWRVGNQDKAQQAWARCLKLHQRRVTDGKETLDEKLVASVKGKMDAAAAGKPAVATSAAD
jgi:tetratricopeptide (TPR) repeat protein